MQCVTPEAGLRGNVGLNCCVIVQVDASLSVTKGVTYLITVYGSIDVRSSSVWCRLSLQLFRKKTASRDDPQCDHAVEIVSYSQYKWFVGGI